MKKQKKSSAVKVKKADKKTKKVTLSNVKRKTPKPKKAGQKVDPLHRLNKKQVPWGRTLDTKDCYIGKQKTQSKKIARQVNG